MEDIINSPKFRDKQMLFNDDADLWADALSEYDKMLRGIRDDDIKETTTTMANSPADDYPRSEDDDNDVPYVPSPTPAPMPRARTIVKVTHADKILRVEASIAERETKVESKRSRSEAQGCSQGASFNRMKMASDLRAEGELAVSDRFLKNGQMTQSMMYGSCGQPNPTGTVCFGVPSGCVEIGRCRLVVSFGYKTAGYVSEKKVAISNKLKSMRGWSKVKMY